jgi:murein DD-endopeptidase MepM/ murein hydrolase activator NlpD
VNIVAKEGDWYKISHSGGTAYVHANYISTPGQDATGVAPTQPGSGDTPSNPATPAPTTAPAPGNGRFGAPVVANMPSRTSSEYGPRNMYGRSYHYGVDLPIANGTPLQAMGDGVVVSVGYQNSGGRYVVIRYDNGYQSSYCHLQSASVSAGQRVSMGQVVARSDNTGQSTGPHLHLGMKRNGSWVNPRDVPGLVLPPRR